jgi:hypothetical protein
MMKLTNEKNEKPEKPRPKTHEAEIPWKSDQKQVVMVKLSKEADKKKSETTEKKE